MNTHMNYTSLLSTFLFIHLLVFIPTFAVHDTTTSLCSQTPSSPQLCQPAMIDPHKTNQDIIVQRDIAISAAMAEDEQVLHLISSMDKSAFDGRVQSALADCLKFYKDSIQKLNRALSSNNIEKDYFNVQTLLSSALTDHQTCQNGFDDFNLSATYSELFPLSSSSKDICNSLSMNKVVMAPQTILSAPFSKKSKGWSILDHDMPEWLSASDRRILQGETPPANLVVAQDGSGNYKTISEALAVAKNGTTTTRFVIYVKKGVYTENVEITLVNLMLVGDGIDATVVTGSRSVVGTPHTTTYNSSTFGAGADGFGLIVMNMTFENTAGPQNGQAVAARSDSDFSVFYKCSFKGYQDTLYVRTNRQFYRNCDIYGTVDFIFGDATAVLQNCNIYVRKPQMNQFNAITAQKRECPDGVTGIVLHNCSITAASDLKPVQSMFKTYLGRPWGNYSRTVVMKSFLDDLIDPSGWIPWDTHPAAINTLYYGEYMNNGTGASTVGRVKWQGYHIITDVAEAEKFTVGSFLNQNSWLEATKVPFNPGL